MREIPEIHRVFWRDHPPSPFAVLGSSDTLGASERARPSEALPLLHPPVQRKGPSRRYKGTSMYVSNIMCKYVYIYMYIRLD